MNFIITDSNYKEIGFINNVEIDFEDGTISDGNASNETLGTFQATIKYSQWNKNFDNGSIIYCPDTEWGGIVQKKKSDTANSKITFTGMTARGLLRKEFIQPTNPTTESYYSVSGEANTAIKAMLSNRFGDLFVVDNIGSSGITVNHDLRDNNLLYALDMILSEVNSRLSIKWQLDNEKVSVHICAVHIQNLSNDVNINNDYGVALIAEESTDGYNHCLALGSGELTERLRVNVYRKEDGTYTTDSSATGVSYGLARRTYILDDVNTTTTDDLYTKAVEKLEESWTDSTLSITISNVNVEIGDIISAKDDITNISMQKAVTNKILKGTVGKTLSITYKVGD